jgi:splicing factor U2AF subunit
MGRSRSRSNERKRSKKDKSPPPPTRSSGKWDEGFGGIYLPGTGPREAGNPGLTLPTVGELCVRKLIVNNIPKSETPKDVVEQFTAAILSATGHQDAIGIYPVVNCQYLTAIGATRNAMVEFRTPISANVALTVMNGKNGLKIKRPKDYPKDLPAEGISEPDLTKVSLDDIGGPGDAAAMALPAITSSETDLAVAGEGDISTTSSRLSVYGLPGNLMSEQIVKDLFSQFGKIRSMGFPKDSTTGLVKPSSTGYVEYEEVPDAAVAELAMNGFPCGNSVVKVQRIQMIKAASQQTAVMAPRRAVPSVSVASSVTAKILANPILAAQIKQGRDLGSRPSLVVQILNAVYAEDIANDSDYNDIVKEVKEEASRFGHVDSIKIPRSGPGVGKIFVQYVDLTSARKFQQDMNGRSFDNRVVCAAFYPIDRFLQGKYTLYTSGSNSL